MTESTHTRIKKTVRKELNKYCAETEETHSEAIHNLIIHKLNCKAKSEIKTN